MDKLKEVFKTENCINLNRNITRKIGINNSLILSLLVQRSFVSKLNYFPYTINDLIRDSELSKNVQAKIMNKLVELNLIKLERKGVYNKRYITLNEDTIIHMAKIE